LAFTSEDEVGVVSGTCRGGKKVRMILVWNSEERRPHERHRRKWEYNIKMYPNEIGYKSMDWIQLAQDRENGRFL
jgi:hypothetical protein